MSTADRTAALDSLITYRSLADVLRFAAMSTDVTAEQITFASTLATAPTSYPSAAPTVAPRNRQGMTK